MYHSFFSWDFDINDKKILCEKSPELYQLHKCARDYSLNIDHILTVMLPSFQKSHASGAHDLSAFASTAGTYNIIITLFIQNFSDLHIPWSLVCIADIKKGNISLGQVILKIIQPSLLSISKPRSHGQSCIFPHRLTKIEDLIYQTLLPLQRAVIPYYFRLHKLMMPNKYIKGVTMGDENKSDEDKDDNEDDKDNHPVPEACSHEMDQKLEECFLKEAKDINGSMSLAVS
ncbi:uncharacterized protein BT62DRAFT_924713 [Guyanagaster necrorhizus]|uniref:Uncharacterized protein n=1 Tax=Guyanagaster necrorhizus TaxID=856835 RepID=A0A9P7VF41_9AGAR|nr:uncharacterized protein BT62DRAFT_924713 [Guyanagaster necrorhizus MCA 3950]KAG7439427.1 hypothetical protein BT62DRAFT_924713 [Guyanagaster necrorhizus MCA 3950]